MQADFRKANDKNLQIHLSIFIVFGSTKIAKMLKWSDNFSLNGLKLL